MKKLIFFPVLIFSLIRFETGNGSVTYDNFFVTY